jgi:hypothetical protein
VRGGITTLHMPMCQNSGASPINPFARIDSRMTNKNSEGFRGIASLREIYFDNDVRISIFAVLRPLGFPHQRNLYNCGVYSSQTPENA